MYNDFEKELCQNKHGIAMKLTTWEIMLKMVYNRCFWQLY
jgi:hypothetical protein